MTINNELPLEGPVA